MLPDSFTRCSGTPELSSRCCARPDIEARFPDLMIAEEEYGVLDLRGSYSEPDRYLPALTAKVRDLGVQIQEGQVVEEFLIEGGSVTGVRTSESGELRADAVVCTVNAWANSLLSGVGQPLPVRNFVHERYVTKPLQRPPRLPATNDDAKKVYYRPTEDDRLLLGTGSHEPQQVPMPGSGVAVPQAHMHDRGNGYVVRARAAMITTPPPIAAESHDCTFWLIVTLQNLIV